MLPSIQLVGPKRFISNCLSSEGESKQPGAIFVLLLMCMARRQEVLYIQERTPRLSDSRNVS